MAPHRQRAWDYHAVKGRRITEPPARQPAVPWNGTVLAWPRTSCAVASHCTYKCRWPSRADCRPPIAGRGATRATTHRATMRHQCPRCAAAFAGLCQPTATAKSSQPSPAAPRQSLASVGCLRRRPTAPTSYTGRATALSLIAVCLTPASSTGRGQSASHGIPRAVTPRAT
ncbi:hypothetical protein E2562_002397 [Oryza meyeriana var. granulata]|uniref:Uncharacterized protein n=1 Tax=Oryza meyeriana var. granulata TaxID=110450 RepID=A0A6G1BJV9_9ORYZ|nr:hypothetical protein E2562_002397 [Oryza meyeriana var. granulata]